MINFVLNYISHIFYKVLYMSIISIFVGTFILAIRKTLDKKISPKWKCHIWLLLMVSLIVPIKFQIQNTYKSTEIISIAGLIEPIQNIANTTNINTKEENNLNSELNPNDKEINSEESIENKLTHKNIALNIIIPIIWITGITLNGMLLILGNIKINNNLKGKKYNDHQLDELIEESKKAIGVKAKVNIILQNFKQTPAIIGIFNPKILITNEFLLQDERTKKYIIMHELSHYKRKDLIFNYALLLITILHWFNPFIWVFFKKIRQDIELATDEMVLNKLNESEKKEYGRTLINSLKIFQNEKYTAKLLCVTDDSKNMERRIKMLKLSQKFKKNKLPIAIVSIIVIIIGILLFFTQNNKIQL